MMFYSYRCNNVRKLELKRMLFILLLQNKRVQIFEVKISPSKIAIWVISIRTIL